MKKQIWQKGNEIRIYVPMEYAEWYYHYYNRTYWIDGTTLYWLLNNGWEQI